MLLKIIWAIAEYGFARYAVAMDKRVEKVAGGFHAFDDELGVTVFGRTEAEALQALEESRKRAMRLDLLAIAQGGTARFDSKKNSGAPDAQEEDEIDKAG